MVGYSLRRLLQAVIVMLVVATVVFALERLSGNVVDVLAGGRVTPQELARLSHSLGLDQPLYVQYFRFLSQLLHGDLGTSYVYNTPVSTLVANAFPYSAVLGLAAFLLAAVFGLALGMVAALKPRTWVDKVATGTALIGQSVPSFWLGLLLLLLFAVTLRWVPVYGAGGIDHLIIPSLALCALPLAQIARLTRSSLIDVLRADHTLFERSKGVGKIILLTHVMRNAALPVITMLGIQLGGLLAGTVVIETLFAWPGLGFLAIQSVDVRDYPVIQGVVIVEAAIFVFVNLLVDLSYGLFDPRVRLGGPPHRLTFQSSIRRLRSAFFFGGGRQLATQAAHPLPIEGPLPDEPETGGSALAFAKSGVETGATLGLVLHSEPTVPSIQLSAVDPASGLDGDASGEATSDAALSGISVGGLLGVGTKLMPAPSRRRTRLIPRGFPRWSFAVLLVFALAGLLGPLLAPHPPEFADLKNALLPPAFQAGGNWSYPLGTDQLGRDLFSRLLSGARVSLLVALVAVLVSGTIGLAAGVVSGYVGGRVDAILMRIVDAVLAFPVILLAIVLAAIFGPSATNVIIVISVAGWATYARVIRSQVLSLKTQDFVTMSRVMGAGPLWIIRRHLVPNVVGSLLVLATLQLGAAILTEGSLSFIGIGVPPPAPSWGGMLADSRSLMTVAWWLPTLPGLALALVVMASNLMGDWFGHRR